MESDPEHYKAMEILADLREKMQESMKLPPEEQKKYWERLADEEARKYPQNPLGPCRDKNATCRSITQAFGNMTNLGYGDLQELCDLTVFHEALERFDLEECRDNLGDPDSKEPLSNLINRCLFFNIEEIVRERLLNDNYDEEQVEDTYIEAGHASFISPLDMGWVGPLAEEAAKRFKEEL
jgi:hypothetical protein